MIGTGIKIFSGSSHPELTKSICDCLGIDIGKSDVIRFSNENIMVEIQDNVRNFDTFVVQTASAPANDHLVELLVFIHALKNASAARVTAVMPYFFYVRSDKKDRPRISIAARLMADLIQTAGADRVILLDLHADQIQGFFSVPSDHLFAAKLLCKHLESTLDLSNAVAVASDAGEAKGIGRYANRLKIPIAIIDKRREADDEKAKAVALVGDVKGKTAILFDDEIATAGTIISAAEYLKTKGAEQVVAVVTHAVLSGDGPKKLASSPISPVIVTDSIPIPEEKRFPDLQIVSVDGLLAAGIMRSHDGRSVSNLF
ncbi:ribose-phosphate diphosphokinase [Patescibacteria group bacterium]|nr:ribose-phosphate diphosphokinase [Patescibacteria group bacterium]MBU1895871.1 ribose-phosphate diphosphokinase [Patescibacteria group bacterium]